MTAAHDASTGTMSADESMARHTTWRVGGPARRFYRPADEADLARFVASLPDAEPLIWLGLGSNLLVRDGGIAGTVIATHGALGALSGRGELEVEAGAGVACAKIAKQCARWGLGGGAFFAGIPGTLGGALAMNAGAWGGATWERVVSVRTLARDGTIRIRGADDYEIGYRSVRGPADEWFVSATLRFEPGDTDGAGRIKALLAKRNASQPIGLPSCGSVFRNPPGDHAARLIEAAGLKGKRIGGAVVSPKHANFIINTGTATAGDIETLIEGIQAAVARVHGVVLETEVRIVGDPR